MRIWTDLKSEIAALGPQSLRFAKRKELRSVADVLDDDEHILALAQGVFDGRSWLLAGTTRRVLFLDQVMFVGLKKMEIILDGLKQVTFEKGLASNNIVLHRVDGAACRVTKVPKAAAEEFCTVLAWHYGFENAPTAPAISKTPTPKPTANRAIAEDFQVHRGAPPAPAMPPPALPPVIAQSQSFEYQCPHCRAILGVDNAWINLDLDCPECRATVKPRPTLRTITPAPVPGSPLNDDAPWLDSSEKPAPEPDFKYSNSIFPWWVWLLLSLLVLVVIVGVSNKTLFSCDSNAKSEITQ